MNEVIEYDLNLMPKKTSKAFRIVYATPEHKIIKSDGKIYEDASKCKKNVII